VKVLRRILTNEFLLGSLVAILSVLTALAGYQGSMADSNQNQYEINGMKNLNDGNAAYLEANQFIVYDYAMYDGWYVTDDETKAEYYQSSYSQQLQDSIAANPDDPFSEAYYTSMYADAQTYWDESDTEFDLAGQYDTKGDDLQLVMLLMALGLAFSAWAALIREESFVRLVFGAFSIIMLITGLVFYIPVLAKSIGA
jgi:uroporphyrinogen-III decarboxylase